MHEQLIKWLSEIIKKKQKEECHICLLIGDAVLVFQKFIVMSQKDGCWYGIKTNILHITYTNSEINIGLLYICPHIV